MLTVLRFLFLVPAGFVAATLAAAFALVWPFVDLPPSPDPFLIAEIVFAVIAQAAQIGAAIILPFALFVLASEVLGLSSILLHLLAGVLGGGTLLVLAYGRALPHASIQVAAMVAALSFALVYWIVAGNSAGRWRARFRAPTPAPRTDEG
ncbi:hypothetical protein [Aurantimonas sp. Leaf443]|uniref:hypothetical protein n=1 Tax=Aurantimonas sp. Leaf443 TaxID=1736378 RepID=UPI0006F44727|nr:hypothetical protein [Aurantimonas sp. Leaf443]KQT85440.1 hypothetical protein ASG48_09405 [Aurantimonas sp. Leaf443]